MTEPRALITGAGKRQGRLYFRSVVPLSDPFAEVPTRRLDNGQNGRQTRRLARKFTRVIGFGYLVFLAEEIFVKRE